ncbi:MAG: PAS domain-containing protein [Burkholderiaceae bacterium]
MKPSAESAAPFRGAMRVALLYAVFAALWILLSDRAIGWLIDDPAVLVRVSMIKGWSFVAVTTLLLYILVRRQMVLLNESHRRERAEAEERARASQLLAAVAKSSSDAIFAKDGQGRYLLINDAAARYMGRPAQAFLGQDDFAAFPADQAEMIMANDRRVLSSGRVETSEERLVTDVGERVFLATKGPLHDARGDTVGTFGISRDITERKDAERRLIESEQAVRASEERLRLAMAAASQGMYDLNLETGETTVSAEYAHMLGYDPSDFQETRQSWMERMHPEDRGGVIRALDDYLAGRVPAYRVEFRLRTREGHWKWVLSMGQIEAWSTEGLPLRLLGTHTDIDALKSAESTLREIDATLEARVGERTAELSAAYRELETYAYAVSHDLRAPLRVLSGYSQALLEDCGDVLQGQARAYLDRINQSAARMGDLIEGILALSRSSRGELRHDRVDISTLARQRLSQLAEETGRSVAFDVEDDLVVNGDRRMLSSVLTNLIDNAWKYTGSTPFPSIQVRACEHEGLRGFRVVDNGAGFDMRHAEKLFKPFQRLHRDDQFPGIGVGLATVQRIVHRHGGQISVKASPGAGAAFCVVLPEGAAGEQGDTAH